jgi:hypothetical protein
MRLALPTKVREGFLGTTLVVLQVITSLAVLLTPGFIIAGVMGLAREGPRGRFFFVEQAFYWTTMLYPLLWIIATVATLIAVAQKQLLLGCFIQAMPFWLPAALYFAANITAAR